MADDAFSLLVKMNDHSVTWQWDYDPDGGCGHSRGRSVPVMCQAANLINLANGDPVGPIERPARIEYPSLRRFFSLRPSIASGEVSLRKVADTFRFVRPEFTPFHFDSANH